MKTTCLMKYERPTPMLAAAAFVVFLVVATNAASAQQIPLTLIDSWTGAPFGTNPASVELDDGVVRFRGAIAGGINDFAFDMPARLYPSDGVPYMPLDLCDATYGVLSAINVGVIVSENNDFNDEQCFSSLDGVSMLLHKGSQPLTLINGWMTSQLGVISPSARLIGAIVHLRGSIQGGTTANPFVMPASLRPAATVFIPVVLGCNIPGNGRLQINPDGTVTIEAESGMLEDATCFTSLDGAWYAKNASGFTPLQLINGWTNAPYSTSNAEVKMINGVVMFKGAIALGTTAEPFVLPQAFWPKANVYLHTDLCMTTNGRLFIQPNGTVTIQEENDDFANAQCFTSLDGVSFVQ